MSTLSPTQQASTFEPYCIASTGSSFCSPSLRAPLAFGTNSSPRSNLFRRAQFSPDGTAIIAHNEDQCLRSFILPEDLLKVHGDSRHLGAYSTFPSSTNIQSFTIYPHFALQDTSTTLVLAAGADVPITLRNALHYDTIHAHYPFQNALNEEHRSARSLAFTRHGTHFLAGGDNILAVFDCARSGDGPISENKLRAGRKAVQTDAWHLSRKGIVSALSISNDGVLALGTTQSEVATYEHDGMGNTISIFTIDPLSGCGVTDLKWSPDARYLYVAQRQSDVVDVYDVRGMNRKLACLLGRNARTTQRLGIDVVSTTSGHEVWAGGTDGCVRMWSNPSSKHDQYPPDAEMQLHEAPVAGTIWHPTGAIMATCSGKPYNQFSGRDSDDDKNSSGNSEVIEGPPDNTLKVWTI